MEMIDSNLNKMIKLSLRVESIFEDRKDQLRRMTCGGVEGWCIFKGLSKSTERWLAVKYMTYQEYNLCTMG